MNQDEKPDPVGYKRPPRAHRFQPGQSGNPSGRPKGERDVQVSKQRALIKSLVAAAIEGNQRAAASVLAMCVRMLADAEDDEATEGEDQEIVEAFAKRKKRAAAAGGKA